MRENPRLCPMNELLIDRHPGFRPNVGLFGEEQEPLGQLPFEWSDEDIRIAVQFANKAYSKGYEEGAMDKACDIRKVLGL